MHAYVYAGNEFDVSVIIALKFKGDAKRLGMSRAQYIQYVFM